MCLNGHIPSTLDGVDWFMYEELIGVDHAICVAQTMKEYTSAIQAPVIILAILCLRRKQSEAQ